jgi:hypothetical protein
MLQLKPADQRESGERNMVNQANPETETRLIKRIQQYKWDGWQSAKKNLEPRKLAK